jgi:putative addiction module antidote
MTSNTIRRIGDELLVPVSEEMLASLGLHEGDEVVTTVRDGVVELTAPEPDVERQMEIARRGMEKYRNALAELAK